MKTAEEMIAEAKSQITEINSDQLNNMINKRIPMVIIDVRDREDYANGKIENAVNIPRGMLELEIEDVVEKRETPIVLYCGGGSRSALAAKTLQEMGYKQVVSLEGGFRGFKHSKGLL